MVPRFYHHIPDVLWPGQTAVKLLFPSSLDVIWTLNSFSWASSLLTRQTLNHHPQITMQLCYKPNLLSCPIVLQWTVCKLEYGTLHLFLWNFILMGTVRIVAYWRDFELWFCSLGRRAQHMVVYSEHEGLGKRAVDEWFCELPPAN